MARSLLTNTTNDLISDSGSVLWSLVTGEQLEFPITLNFIRDATLKNSNNYTYEAVVIEAENIEGQTSKPTSVKVGGDQKVLNIRVPAYAGVWSAPALYNKGEVSLHNGVYYILDSGVGYSSPVAPDVDPNWTETTLNKVYLQFPADLGSTWSLKASVTTPVYGFFELRVTEPSNVAFQQTWKPIRGMVELLFSPTDYVPG